MPSASLRLSSFRISWHTFGWAAGLPVLALLWAASSHTSGPMLTDSLAAAGSAIARSSGYGEGGAEPWLRIEAEGRDLVALGEAPDAASRETALARLAAIPGLRRLIDQTGFVEDASPFVWQARIERDGRIALSGNRPVGIGASALAARLSAVLPEGAATVDHARAARGAPPEFLAAAVFAAGLLRSFKPGAAIVLSDTGLTVEGEAKDLAAYDTARVALAALPHGYTLARSDVLPPAVADFRFTVERRPDGAVHLTGNVASEAARAELRAAAAEMAAGAATEDRMLTARGPDGLDSGALERFAMRIATLLREGSVRFEAGVLTVSGVTLDTQAVTEIETLMRANRPAGLTAGPVRLTARPVSPYALRIRREADTVSLTGHLPDQGARDALLAALRNRFFHVTLADRTRTDAGAPAGLLAAVSGLVGPLSTLAGGEIALTDRQIRLTGTSLYPESAERLRQAPPALPGGWSAQVEIGTSEPEQRLDAPTCTRLFAERVTAHPLHFAPGSSDLTPDFYPVLDAAAEIAGRCPNRRVEVTGHGDPAGAAPQVVKALPEYTSSIKEAPPSSRPVKGAKKSDPRAKVASAASQAGKPEPQPAAEPLPDLVEQRAQAVVDYLRKAGLPANRTAAAPGGAERRALSLVFGS